MDAWIIRYNKNRYPDIIKDPPEMIIVAGPVNYALDLSMRMSDYYPGCDHLFYVEGLE